MVLDALPASKQDRTYKSLAELMGMGNTTELSADEKRQICDNTLIRRIEHFDPDSVLWQSTLQMQGADEQPLSFVTSKRQLPNSIPDDWNVTELSGNQVRVVCQAPLTTMLPELRRSKVTSAGQLPSGFDPAALYSPQPPGVCKWQCMGHRIPWVLLASLLIAKEHGGT